MKKQFKVMSSAALATALAVPAVAGVAPVTVDAAETSIQEVAIDNNGEVTVVSYDEFVDAILDGEAFEGDVVGVSVEEDSFISYSALADALFDNTDKTTLEILEMLSDDEEALVDEDTLIEWGVIDGTASVESVSAINATTIEVTWNNGETTEVELDEELEVGENEVTFTYEEEEYTATVNFEAPTATDLTVLNSQLPLRDDVVISYQYQDQYGQDIDVDGDDFTVTVYNVTEGETVNNFDRSTTDGQIDLDLAANSNVEVGDEIRVTLLNNDSGLKETVNLPVVSAEMVNQVTLGDVVLPEDEVRLPEDTTDLTLNYTATDQYGNDVTLQDTSELTFISSDNSVVNSNNVNVITKDGEKVLSLDTENVVETKEVTLTVLVNSTGETSSTKFKVYADSSIESATLTKPEDTTFAVGDTAKLNISAVDQYSDALTNEEIFSQKGSISLTSSNTSVIANDDFTVNNDGTVSVDLTGNTAGTTTLFATIGGETSELKVTVEAARTPEKVTLATEPSEKLIQGAETAIEFNLVDQYGADLADADFADYQVVTSITKVSGDDAGLTKTINDTVAAESDVVGNEYKLTAASDKSGVYKVKAELQDTSGTPVTVSSVERTVEVIADNAEGLTYSVEDFGTLYAEGSANQGYDVAPSVMATDKDGNKVAVPSSVIQDVFSDDASIVDVDAQNEIYGVAKGTATVTVVIETSEGVKTLTKEVTVSDATPKAQSIAVSNDSVTAAEADVEGDLLADTNEVYFTVTDQYGVENEVKPNFFVTNVQDNTASNGTDFDSSDVTFTGSTIAIAEAGAGDKFTLTGVTSNGKSVSTTITLN